MLSCATTHPAVSELKQMRRSASLSLKVCLRSKGTCTQHFFQDSSELNSPPMIQYFCVDVKTVAELDVVLKPLR